MGVDNLFFLCTLVLYLAALITYGLYLFLNQQVLGRWGILFMLLGFLIHTLLVLQQAAVLIHAAVIGLFDVLVLLSWSLVGLSLLLQSRIRLRILLGIILVIVLAIGGIALLLPRYFSKVIPSINVFSFGTHIFLSLMGYASFAVALLSGLMYLVLDRQLKLKVSNAFFERLPPLESLEWINFRSLWAGTILLGLGLVSGLVWAYWAGIALSLKDSKVVATCVTFVVYGVILYIRSTARWRGRKVAYLSVLGFTCVLITFIMMNYFSKGHGFF